MPTRLRFYDVRTSDYAEAVGLCSSDMIGVANSLNSAQRRLLYCKEAGEESWIGTWAEIAFTVSRANPYVTFGRDIARLEAVDICNTPVSVNNQFFEYLRFGNGRLPKEFRACHCSCWTPQVYTRNNSPTFVDLFDPPQLLRVRSTSTSDVGKRVLMQGLDANDTTIYTQDGFQRVEGIFGAIADPYFQWPLTLNRITGIQKDVTQGQVTISQVDPNTGVETVLVTMQPTETTAWYRRYYFDSLPWNCCSFSAPNPCSPNQPTSSVQVTAIAKLEFIPVVADTDYCLIGNLEALKEEGMSYRYSKMDSLQSKQLEEITHKKAIRLLNGEIAHYLGIKDPAINLAVFGTARLEKRAIGCIL